MVRCTIHLENNANAVFFAGQLLKGTVEMFLDQPKKLRGLSIIVYGAAYCHWTKSKATRKYPVDYEGKEVYINTKTYLFGRDGGDSKEVQAGTHRYEFACQLPPFLPASFGSRHGNINYTIEASLDIPWGFDKEFKLQFTVVRNDDLNVFPDLKVPSKITQVRMFSCSHSEPLMMTASIPFSGYAPGQIMKINIDYINKSDIKVKRTIISLRRCIAYISQKPNVRTKTIEEIMIQALADGVKSSSENSYQVEMQIPSVLVNSNTSWCSVIKVWYVLKVKAEVGGMLCHRNVKMDFPITIGSTKLNFDLPSEMPQQQVSKEAPVAVKDMDEKKTPQSIQTEC